MAGTVGAGLIAGAARAEPDPHGQSDRTLTRIAFGSCAKSDKPQPIWDAVLAARPDLFIFLGDNVYLDTRDPAVMRRKYAELAAQPGFQRLKASGIPILATWDDHDFGENDAGADYPMKEESRRLFLDFFGAPADSPRARRYSSSSVARRPTVDPCAAFTSSARISSCGRASARQPGASSRLRFC
jgi:alkaline phosphatase D